MSVRIQTDAEERIEVTALDGSLSPLTGLTDVLLSIRRVSDGQWYDFNDDTFKSSGWTTRQQQMSETDSTNDPGNYHYDFDTSQITNAADDDTYEMRAESATSANMPQSGELKVGQYVDELDSSISSREAEADAATRAGTNQTEHDATQAQIAALENLSQADVQAAMTAQGYTTGRAPNLDNADVATSSREAEADAATRAGTNQTEHDATQAQIAALPTPPTASAIADSVLEELVLDHHTVAGSLAEYLVKAVGVAQENTVIDGGAGAAEIVYDTTPFALTSRLRIFATPAEATAATPGAADGADGEIARVTYTGTPHGTYAALPGSLKGVGS